MASLTTWCGQCRTFTLGNWGKSKVTLVIVVFSYHGRRETRVCAKPKVVHSNSSMGHAKMEAKGGKFCMWCWFGRRWPKIIGSRAQMTYYCLPVPNLKQFSCWKLWWKNLHVWVCASMPVKLWFRPTKLSCGCSWVMILQRLLRSLMFWSHIVCARRHAQSQSQAWFSCNIWSVFIEVPRVRKVI